jgi:hypothetical protein
VLAETLCHYPHFISYFNEVSGGSSQGLNHLAHSNLDWGQGLAELDRVLDQHPEWGPVAIAYSGPVSPEVLGSRALPLNFTVAGSPLDECSHVAISVNILLGDTESYPWYQRNARAAHFERFFRTQVPLHHTDGSIFIFDASTYTHPHDSGEGQAIALKDEAKLTPANGTRVQLPTLAQASDSDPLTIAGLCHVLLLNGFGDTGLKMPTSGTEALRLLTDDRAARSVFHDSPLVRTRNGLRYRLAKSAIDNNSALGESHRDQCLATFAAIGLSLDDPIRFEGESHSLRDLLSESVANFTFDQRELSWTAQAFATYIPPAKSWIDRFGKETTFSELTNELLRRGHAHQSCAGTHALQALARIMIADQRSGILHRQARLEVRSFLDLALGDAIRNQRDDGSWDYGWTEGTRRPAELSEFNSQVIVTGHLLEILLEMEPRTPRRVSENAADWLIHNIVKNDFQTAPIPTCPLTHAVKAARLSLHGRSPWHRQGGRSHSYLSPN